MNAGFLVLNLFGWPGHHIDGEDRKDDRASNRDGAAGDVEEAHEERAGGEQDNCRDDRRHNHLPAHGPLRLCIEVLGLFEERHQCDFGTHTDEQKQKQLQHELDIDFRENH